jgi:hypothetical protein
LLRLLQRQFSLRLAFGAILNDGFTMGASSRAHRCTRNNARLAAAQFQADLRPLVWVAFGISVNFYFFDWPAIHRDTPAA